MLQLGHAFFILFFITNIVKENIKKFNFLFRNVSFLKQRVYTLLSNINSIKGGAELADDLIRITSSNISFKIEPHNSEFNFMNLTFKAPNANGDDEIEYTKDFVLVLKQPQSETVLKTYARAGELFATMATWLDNLVQDEHIETKIVIDTSVIDYMLEKI